MLEQLLEFDHIAIQCHDNPDADAIASAYGLYRYFRDNDKSVIIFYGGQTKITKPNLGKMIELLHIPLLHYPEEREWPGLLVTVDCQYGAGNASPMRALEVAVIDHHVMERTPPPRHDIRPYLGSCSTLVWTMLRRAGFRLDSNLATALYYGLFSDTGGLAEVRHPLDRDLRDSVRPNARIMRVLKNSNLSRDDLALTSAALKEMVFDDTGRFALVSAQTTDANILGFISDLVMQVDDVDIGVVYSRVPGGIKYSVRTLLREFKASEVAAWLAGGELGSGGGHFDKAGGYISAQRFAFACPGVTVAEYFARRIKEYLAGYAVLDCTQGEPDISVVADVASIRSYEKTPVSLAYVPCAELLEAEAATLDIRMFEGDITIEADAETYLMVGLEGEIYPISRAKFEQTYTPLDANVLMNFEYPPAVLAGDNGQRIELSRLARACEGRGGGAACAVLLRRGVKLFTRWDTENYIKGEPGDWLIWAENDPLDIYVVTARMFPRLYSHAGAGNDACAAAAADYTGRDLARLPGACAATKTPRQFDVRIAPASGFVYTLEGPVPYARGDAIICGAAGEEWPVSPAHFKSIYAPVDKRRAGLDGAYVSVPVQVTVLRLEWPFCVKIASGAVLHGQSGDWLVQYPDGSHGVVNSAVFHQLYEID